MITGLFRDLKNSGNELVVLNFYDLDSTFVKVVHNKVANDDRRGIRIGGRDRRSRRRGI